MEQELSLIHIQMCIRDSTYSFACNHHYYLWIFHHLHSVFQVLKDTDYCAAWCDCMLHNGRKMCIRDRCAVAESLGYTVKRIGKYHTLKEMDSIRIYNRSHWYRWSRQFDKGNNGGTSYRSCAMWLQHVPSYQYRYSQRYSKPLASILYIMPHQRY